MAHGEQLREWAENYPPTLADKDALVSAEIARLEKRDADALRLYEDAVHLARENGFVQNEGLAHELVARYYLALGIETAARASDLYIEQGVVYVFGDGRVTKYS